MGSLDDVVLPVEGVEGDRVGVLVQDERGVDAELHDHEALGSDPEGQAGVSKAYRRCGRGGSHFDGVGDEQGGHGDVVEGVVEEDHGEDEVSGVLVRVGRVLGLGEDAGTDGP